MGIYANIKKLADQNGINISTLEKVLELGNGTIRRWDNSPPSYVKIQKVADYFNVTMDSIVGRKVYELDTNRAQNETERRLLLLARRAADIPDEHRDKVISVFEDTIDVYLKVKGDE